MDERNDLSSSAKFFIPDFMLDFMLSPLVDTDLYSCLDESI